MADDSKQEVLVACWQALVAVAGSIPKEMMPSYVRTLKEAVSTAKEKERRKRRPPPLRVAGFCLPKALQPVLPIFLQGVLQVWPASLYSSLCSPVLSDIMMHQRQAKAHAQCCTVKTAGLSFC